MLLWSLEENSPLYSKDAVGILFSLWREGSVSRDSFCFSSFCSQVTSNPPFLPPLPTQLSHSGKPGPQRLWCLGTRIQRHKVYLSEASTCLRFILETLWAQVLCLSSQLSLHWALSGESEIYLYEHKKCISVYNSLCAPVWFPQPLSSPCVFEWISVHAFIFSIICLAYDGRV